MRQGFSASGRFLKDHDNSGRESAARSAALGHQARSDIPHRRLAEKPAVFPIELARAFIAHLESRTRRIEAAIEHTLPGHVQPQLLLVLKGAHRRKRAELMVQRRYAHPRHLGEFLNAQRLGVIGSQPFHGLRCPMALLSECRNRAQILSLRATQQSINDLPLNQAAEKWNVLRRIKQVHEPGTCVKKINRTDTDGHAASVRGFPAQMKLLLRKYLPYCRHFEFEQ